MTFTDLIVYEVLYIIVFAEKYNLIRNMLKINYDLHIKYTLVGGLKLRKTISNNLVSTYKNHFRLWATSLLLRKLVLFNVKRCE